MSSAQTWQRGGRIHLQLHHELEGSRRHRELAAFVTYCIGRIERDLGQAEQWHVTVGPSVGGFTAVIAVRHPPYESEAKASGFDGPLAVWDAMCTLEQRLRESRVRGRR